MIPVPLPSAPTDNLYKFLALSGVALIIVGFVTPWIALKTKVEKALELDAALLAIEADVKVEEAESKRIRDRIRFLRDMIVPEAEAAWDAGRKPPEWPPLVARAFEHAEGESIELEKRLNESPRRIARLKAMQQTLEQLEREFDVAKTLGKILMIVGSILMAVGFQRWYVLYQRPMDHDAFDGLLEKEIKASARNERIAAYRKEEKARKAAEKVAKAKAVEEAKAKPPAEPKPEPTQPEPPKV